MTLGQRIRRLRQERGWSQAQLGLKLGAHQKQISGYERDVHVPSSELLIRIAEAFDVSLDYLVSGDKDASQRIEVADRELIRHMEAVDKLPEKDREAIKAVLESFILKHRFQQLASGAAVG
jgi:transcriptional regulator with XRE-family HTH domain